MCYTAAGVTEPPPRHDSWTFSPSLQLHDLHQSLVLLRQVAVLLLHVPLELNQQLHKRNMAVM
ncbi:hypothetical protein EYF80_037039 [Liparis tanakae]|uniref:Uncharacterized protein n=1 Tax=Liparis tanakae TaxID=230148 RepID=A0A4Z2GHU2_9TELE|nr:hypothetical protein EYF80_037039 [Liparis tanakae]